MIRTFAMLAVLAAALPAYAEDLPVVPDPTLTPGATNPAVTQDNIHQTIRPPASFAAYSILELKAVTDCEGLATLQPARFSI